MTSWRKSVSPYSGGTVPDLHRSSLTVRRFVWRDPSIDLVAGLAIAVDLDAVLADTRPVWDAWLEDASRRARVELAVPADAREATERALVAHPQGCPAHQSVKNAIQITWSASLKAGDQTLSIKEETSHAPSS